jgi:hypothetical protein
MIATLLALALTAQADVSAPPIGADATLAADGYYTLVLRPDVDWARAEVLVDGDVAHEVGASPAGKAVHVEGTVDQDGPFPVTITAVRPNGVGVTWMFDVTPERVPVTPPAPTPHRRRRRGIAALLHDWFHPTARPVAGDDGGAVDPDGDGAGDAGDQAQVP